ncbi:TetR family transcriptional regulator, partial [Mycobacterium avium 11-0986]
MTATDGEPDLGEIDPFRLRLLDGLATSIGERGYRASTVADVVRCARTSKRTFYDHFAGKEECFLELLAVDIEKLGAKIAASVDPEADWHVQIRQAVEAYVGYIEARPAITLSWIRELPSLGAAAGAA